MSKILVVVESPTKAKTISRFLGGSTQVMASQGHVRDLPERTLGVDIAQNFKPDYELTANGKKIVKQLKQAAAGVSDIYLATDPDREGEAIAWHLQEVLKGSGTAAFHRITFHEITQSAIQHSFANPGSIDFDMVDAQQARRVLDRIVGYQVSPLLWRNIKKGTSAGRVQTVALRLVVEREREIQAFVPVEYWNLDALFETLSPKSSFKTRLARVNGEKVQVSSGGDAQRLADALQSAGVTHTVSKVTSTPRKKNPMPPFITSTLQQAAGSALRLGASQTMRIAQELYEGINIGGGQVGLITYMRTDSVNIAKEAQAQALTYIANTYGKEFLPDKPNVYRSRKTAQEAHEAIRPTDMQYTPDAIAQYLSPQQLKVYRLIWNRFIASQMAPARQLDHLIEVDSKGGELDNLLVHGLISEKDEAKSGSGMPGVVCQFRAAARETVFPGFLKVYSIKEVGEEEDPDEMLNTLPQLPLGTQCNLLKLNKEQCFTQPPSRYSEASLVKALEQNGVGRPSTYATTVNTIQVRDYVTKDKGSLAPTELGCKTCDFLVQQMPDLFNVGFTAQMEDELDQVEEGKMNWVDMLKLFYASFQIWLGLKTVQGDSNSEDLIRKLLDCFPPDFQFAEPVLIGRKKYDDAKFVASIRERSEAGEPLTERQWNAMLYMVARYIEKSPEILTILDEYGHGEEVREMMAEIKKAEEAPVIPVAPEALKLLAAMDGLKFNPATKRGKRTFDDSKFVASIQKQAESGKALSEAQTTALLKIASRYAALIDGYQELSSALAATLPQSEAQESVKEEAVAPVAEPCSDEEKEKINAILALVAEIKEWKTASKTGKRSFDDKTFVTSVSTQFTQKGSLSPKQVSALLKVLGKYSNQIPNFEERTQGMELPNPKSAEIDEVCPLCGSKLVVRYARGRSFIGCSGYPKCRYIGKK